MSRMAYHVTRASLEAAVRHLVRYGDTDIFPHLPELAFFADEEAAIVDELAKLDLDSYAPAGGGQDRAIWGGPGRAPRSATS